MAIVSYDAVWEGGCPHCKGKLIVTQQTYADGRIGTPFLIHADEEGAKTEVRLEDKDF